jgi:hypothetical protein
MLICRIGVTSSQLAVSSAMDCQAVVAVTISTSHSIPAPTASRIVRLSRSVISRIAV